MKKTILTVIILLCFGLSGCKTNKTVYITAVEPVSFEENGITVSASNNQDYWIYFDPKEYPAESHFQFLCDEKPDYLKIKGIQIKIDELNITVSKKIDEHVVLDKSKRDETKYSGYFFNDKYIFTQELIDEWNRLNSSPVTSSRLYNKFKTIKELTYSLEIEYLLKGVKYNRVYDFKYKTRNVTSLRFWDNWMSI